MRLILGILVPAVSLLILGVVLALNERFIVKHTIAFALTVASLSFLVLLGCMDASKINFSLGSYEDITINQFKVSNYEREAEGFSGAPFKKGTLNYILGENDEEYRVYDLPDNIYPELKQGYYSNIEFTRTFMLLSPINRLLHFSKHATYTVNVKNTYLRLHEPIEPTEIIQE